MAFEELDEDEDGDGPRSGRTSRPRGRRMVAAVGAALIVVAALGPVTNLGLAITLNSIRSADPPQPPPGLTPGERTSWQRGRDSAPGCFLIASVLVSLIYIPVLIGGLKLRHAEGRGIGITAAVISMLPVSPAFLAGLPIGIWSLVVLNRPEVIEAMTPPEPPRRRRRRDEDEDDYDDRDRRPRRRRDED